MFLQLDLCSEDKFTLAMTVLDQALGYLSNGIPPFTLRCMLLSFIGANTSLQEYFRTDDDAKTLLSDIYGQQGVCQQSLGNIDRAIHCYSRAVEVGGLSYTGVFTVKIISHRFREYLSRIARMV